MAQGMNSKKRSRSQFIPRLPSADLQNYVLSRVSQGEGVDPRPTVTLPSGVHRHEGAGVGPPSASSLSPLETERIKRRDMPVVRRPNEFGLGNATKAHVLHAESETLHRAMGSLVDDMFASSSRAPRDALLNTWTSFHEKWFNNSDIIPLTPEKILGVSSLFKLGRYKSFKNYMSRIKDHHISAGHSWSDKLDLVSRKCTRSVLRGLAPSHRSEQFDLMKVMNALKDVAPLASSGPINPRAMILVSTLFMLRELEASAVDRRDVTFTEDSVTLRLPVSKVDWQAKGCSRTWSCLCDRGLSCPVHVLLDHCALLERTFGDRNCPLFPTTDLEYCTKAGVVNTIREAVLMAKGTAKDGRGNWCISGHTFRITGARTLCAWGLDPITIQLIGRWGSTAVLSYLADAPLQGFCNRLSRSCEFSIIQDVQPKAASDMDLKAHVKSLVNDYMDRIDRTASLRRELRQLTEEVGDIAHQVDGMGIMLNSNSTGKEVWTGRNDASKVAHQSIVDLAEPTSHWKTLCGWSFAGKLHAETIRYTIDGLDGYRKCPKCHPRSPASASSTSASSSSED